MTIGDIIWVITGIASFLGAILVIWNFSNKVKGSLDSNISEVVNKILEKHERDTQYQINCAVEASQKSIIKDIQSLENKLDVYVKEQRDTNRKDYESIKLLKESLIEAYKQDIRDIYYRLRSTGEISDADKSYVDKLFPKYIALGGNSDIEAKYSEICRVYETITQENYRKAREKYLENLAKKEIEESEQ